MVGGQKCGVLRVQSGVKVIFCYGWMNKKRIYFTALEEGFQRLIRFQVLGFRYQVLGVRFQVSADSWTMSRFG